MWKYYFYYHWQYEKAEEYVSNMEQHGYRLLKIKFFHFFKFKKCQPKKTKYIFVYHLLKDYPDEYFDAIQYINGFCGGNQICGKKQFEPSVYRITDVNSDLSSIIKYRNSYLKKTFKVKLLLTSFFWLAAIMGLIFTEAPFVNINGYIMFFIGVLLSLLFLYYLTGLLILIRKTHK